MIEVFREFFRYEPESGRLLWIVKRPGPSSRAIGEEAGNLLADGRYRSVQVRKKRHYVHRIIWQLERGPIPAGLCIDNIDGNGLNNRLLNLRLTTLSGNRRNRRINDNSKTGVIGVIHAARNGFSARCAGKYVGYSKDFDTVVAMRKAAEIEHKYHPNHGRKSNASS